MDTSLDATQTTPVRTKLTPELREQLQKEGKCFYCRKTGHMAYNCPEKGKRQGQPTKACAAETGDNSQSTTDGTKPTTTPTNKPDLQQLVNTFKNLSDEERTKLHQMYTGDNASASDF